MKLISSDYTNPAFYVKEYTSLVVLANRKKNDKKNREKFA